MPRGESPRARNNGEKKIDCPRSFLKKNRIQFLIETKLRAESARTTAKMDKKNTVIGVLLLMAAMYFMYDSSVKEAAAERSARAARAERMAAPSETAKAVPARKAPKQSPFAPDENIPEKIVSLENDKIRINFTNKGGAIKNVELRDYPKAQGSKDPFVFNDIDARVRELWRNVPPVRPALLTISSVSSKKLSELSYSLSRTVSTSPFQPRRMPTTLGQAM